MEVRFLLPVFLVLTLAIPFLWVLPRRTRDRTQGVLRSLALLALVGALARPVLVTADRDVYNVFIIDRSASVSGTVRQQQNAALEQILAQSGNRHTRTLVIVGDTSSRLDREDVFGRDAVEFGETIQVMDSQSGSPLGAALAAALRQIPEGARGVVHLFSDGLATDRHWARETQRLIERGITVNTYDLGRDEHDIYPARIELDGLARVGQTARVEVDVVGAGPSALASEIWTSDTTPGLRVRLVDANGNELATSPVTHASGQRATVSLTFEPEQAGFLAVTAQVLVSPEQDSNRHNNELRRSIAVQDPLRLLYLGDRIQHGADRLIHLLGRGFDVTEGSRLALNAAIDLSEYDLVLLDDRAASKTPTAFQQHLVNAVQHDGLGLVFSGGKSSFGTGGYAQTPLAEIVPVELVQRMETRDPSTALAIIMDTSGSMAGDRIELAKQVARLAVRRLQAHDRVGIVEFYGNKHWALPLQSAANKITIDRAIGRMQAIGGTILLPAIEEAYYGLKNIDARYKHILIITDAGVEESDYESMIRLITKDGVNVSTVLVGPEAHNQVMIDMASWGKGRFYSAADRYSLPELILKQPSTMKLPAYRMGTFSVRSHGGEGWWSDINRLAMPSLDGYVETQARPGAEVLMELEKEAHPLLATWRVGLGRVTALMTEPVGEGTSRWRDWTDYGRMLARVFTRTANDTRAFEYEIRRENGEVTITARRSSRDATLHPRAAVLDERWREGESLSFRQLSPDHFVASLFVDPGADVRLSAAAYSSATPLEAQQPTHLVSIAADDVSPEHQVDPAQGIDLEGLAAATGGAFTDASTLAAGTLSGVPLDGNTTSDIGNAPSSPIGDERSQVRRGEPDQVDALAVFRLWPILLLVALSLYLAEIVYRRSTASHAL